MLSKTKQFALEEVEIAVAAVDLEDVRAFRNSRRSRQLSSASAEAYPRIEVDFSLGGAGRNDFFLSSHSPIEWKFLTPEEEILFGPACWLWGAIQ